MDWHAGVGIAAIAGVALLLPATGPSASSEALGEERLREALLDHLDFSEEWAVDSASAAADRGIGVPVPRERSCQVLFETGAKDSASRSFARSFTGPFVTTTAGAHRSAEDAARALAEFRAAARECASFHTQEGTPQERPVTVHYAARQSAAVETDDAWGDDWATASFSREAEDENAPEVLAEAVLVRIGEHTVLVAQAGRDDADTPPLAPLVSRAVDKLSEVTGGGTPTPEPEHSGTEV